MIGLIWDCIDFNKKTIRIYRQLQKERKVGGEYHFASLKNDKQRVFMVADDVLKKAVEDKDYTVNAKVGSGQVYRRDPVSIAGQGRIHEMLVSAGDQVFFISIRESRYIIQFLCKRIIQKTRILHFDKIIKRL